MDKIRFLIINLLGNEFFSYVFGFYKFLLNNAQSPPARACPDFVSGGI
jgi:hypothetical protein